MCASLRHSRSPPMTLVFKFWVPINNFHWYGYRQYLKIKGLVLGKAVLFCLVPRDVDF